jgi:hypothetical protein
MQTHAFSTSIILHPLLPQQQYYAQSVFVQHIKLLLLLLLLLLLCPSSHAATG